MKRGWRAALINLAVAVGALVLTLLAVEASLRLAGYEYRPLKIAAATGDFRAQHMFRDDNFVYDAELIWKPKAGASVFNSQGFRGDELAPGDGHRWILAVGDSNTLGWAGEAGPHWPGDLEELLRQRDDRFRVANAGVWGYTSHQGVIRLRQMMWVHPEWVLICFGSNDEHPVDVSDRDFLTRSQGELELEHWLGSSAIGRLALGALRTTRRTGDGPATRRVPLDEYRANLREMVGIARAGGARVAIVTRPFRGPIPFQPSWKSMGHPMITATAEVAREEDVPLVDMYAWFKGRDELFSDESHFIAPGHRLAAELVLERLAPVL